MVLLFFTHQHSLFLYGVNGSTHCQMEFSIGYVSTQCPNLAVFDDEAEHPNNTNAIIISLPIKMGMELITYDCQQDSLVF